MYYGPWTYSSGHNFIYIGGVALSQGLSCTKRVHLDQQSGLYRRDIAFMRGSSVAVFTSFNQAFNLPESEFPPPPSLKYI